MASRLQKIAAIALALQASVALGQDGAAQPFTVADGIETRHVLQMLVNDSDPVQVSPTGQRYLLMLTQADIGKDGNWIEFVSGGLGSLPEARARVVARLFSEAKRVSPFVERPVTWLDDGETIAFLWDDGRRPTNVATLNLRTGAFNALRRYTSDITNFSLSNDRKTLVFSAKVDRITAESERLLRSGFAAPEQATLIDILNGMIAGNPIYHSDVLVAKSGVSGERRISLPDVGIGLTPVFLQVGLHMAPDGKYAIVSAPPESIPMSWSSYEDPLMARGIKSTRNAPDEPAVLAQHWLVNTVDGRAHPLWNAPKAFNPDDVSWSPNSRQIAIAPTFLPIDERTSAAGKTGAAAAVVDVESGRYAELSVPTGFALRHRGARWIGADEIQLAVTNRASAQLQWLSFTRHNGGEWLATGDAPKDAPEFATRIRVELRQDLNTPPVLYGTDTQSGVSQPLLEVNPGLPRKFRLGKVELVHWTSADGRAWSGRLYYPVDFGAARRFPLVIKCQMDYDLYREHPAVFSVVGADGNMTIGGAEAMSGRNIATLLVGSPDGGMPPGYTGSPREFETAIAGYEGAILHFVDAGLADPERIGIMGLSRCGDRTAHFLTHSAYPIRAAEMADNLDDGYLQYLAVGKQSRAGYGSDIGAEPIGAGLQTWLREAPGFNIEKIRAPVRFERDSAGISSALFSWEMFSKLRDLGRPVEFYVVPDIKHGSHQLWNPAQLLASQGGTVDWFDFWLNGHEDADPNKQDQYARWRRLRGLQSSAARSAQAQ